MCINTTRDAVTMAVDISPNKDGGVLKEIIREGIGDETPIKGSIVTVHYTGTLLDGTKFDSSRDRNEPFRFHLRAKTIIRAWRIGVITMKRREVCILTCTADYAYGKMGNLPLIPPDATLKFEIEMIDWKGHDLSKEEDGSIEKYKIVSGRGYSTPFRVGTLVNVHLVGMYDGRVFEDRDIQFTTGEGQAAGVIEGVEHAIQSFKAGEKSKLKIKSKHAFKEKGNPEYGIPPNADVEYIVTLESFEKAFDMCTLNSEQSMEQAKIYKEKGTNYFKENNYELAIKMYDKVHLFCDNELHIKRDQNEEKKQLCLSSYLNMALCYLKTHQYVLAKDSCDKALTLDPKNEKALFRRGQAYLALASPEVAVNDFQEIMKMVPTNTAAAKQIAVCNDLIRKQLSNEKKLYANMFDKFAEKDKQKEEEKLREQPDVMRGTLGEWGQEERPGGRDATAFEKENPNILMLNANGTGEFQNM